MYRFERGLRKVPPYYLKFKTHPKPRWIGRTVIDIFTNEFGESREALEQDIKNGLMYIESNVGRKGGSKVIKGLENVLIKQIDGFDVIYNSKHMHEPTVPDSQIKIIYESEDLLVVDKPAGIPTHPTGNYYYNSITEILKKENGYVNLWPFHRLDKVTSGILIFGKTKEASQKYHNVFQNNRNKITKQYIARVNGRFPHEETMINCPIFMVNSTGGYIKPLNAEELPINSTTVFKLLKYNKELNQSIVLCEPLTGRMHQIRIHLRNMGYPIVNDFLYNPSNSKLYNQEINIINNEIEIELYTRLFEKYPQFGQFQSVDKSVISNNECIDLYQITKFKSDPEMAAKIERLKLLRQKSLKDLKDKYNTTCEICNRKVFDTDKDMTDSEIWLHSFKYEYKADINGFLFRMSPAFWVSV
ncbi:DRAP deaminase and pseudouridylate synthase [Scheffersomyces amazonensis]|uniref:DRAP deaminase and pseudouridylate synthase n=1 Tax=Scheffersomyces amazonensis TaxID=1078765 RepID=UPI00315CEC9B